MRAWDEYSITGMTVEWTPTGFYPQPATNTGIAAFSKVEDLNSYAEIQDFSDQKLYTSSGFATLNPRRKFRKYYDFRRLSKQMNVPW